MTARFPSFCFFLVSIQFAPTISSTAVSEVNRDWQCWRGPNGNGIAVDGPALPMVWDTTTNVRWKAQISGSGHSSPIVVGRRVLLTTSDSNDQVQTVICLDRTTGRQQWKTDVNRGGFPKKIHVKNTHATPTLASDGRRIFASFCNYKNVQLTALNMDGEQLWQQNVGAYNPKKYEFGYASSPLIFESMVIIASEFEGGGFLTALNKISGSQMWYTPRLKVSGYSSPIVAHVAGRDQLLMSGGNQITSYQPHSGQLLWRCGAISSTTCGTIVWNENLVFASGGFPNNETAAVRADGSGKVVWRNKQKCYEQSMLVDAGYVYALDDKGVAFCWRAADGEEMWRKRLGGPISASPILANGTIYASNEKGTTFVMRANPVRFELLATNQLGEEAFATPTICAGQIFLRVANGVEPDRRETLYCLEKSGE